MSLRADEFKALKKAQKSLMRCRREIGVAAFAAEQANLKGTSHVLRSSISSLAMKEELIEKWLKQARLEKVRKE